MDKLLQYIAQQLSQHFNQPIIIEKHSRVLGGDINQTYQLSTNAGYFFLKLNDGSLKDMFEKEFNGLELIFNSNSIKTPQPIIHGKFEKTIFLVTEFIEKGNISKGFWQTFARQLAALHKNSNAQFGLSTNNYIGSLEQQNNFSISWAEFYSTQRILPLIKKAFDTQKCAKQDFGLAEKLCNRFSDLFPAEKPALIHGDLWSGNFMSDINDTPVIYDPAVYYGNREMDIAMSLLFGGFDTSFYQSYDEVFHLQPGWKERVRLCQLYPLLVHLLLFGGHYYNSAMRIIKEYS